MQISLRTMETCEHNVKLDDKKNKKKTCLNSKMSSVNFKI